MRNRNPESGFAVLLIYSMAAVVAIMLFMELPRVAFEAQRDREQLLIDRGEQYSRAVQLYVRKFNRYPADLDALNNTQNLRFLRNRYVDPMTGKDEWRLIHVGPGGVFTDSLVYNKPKTGDTATAEPQNFITEGQQVGGNQIDPAGQGVNIAARQRPSDQPGAPGDPNNIQPGLNPAGTPQPGLNQPGLPQFDANGQIIPGTGFGAGPQPGQPAQAGFPGQMQPVFPGQSQPGMAGLPSGMPFPQGAAAAPGQSQQPLVNAPNGASMIGQLLTSPKPGGLAGLAGMSQGPALSSQTDANGNPIIVAAAGSVTSGTGTPAPAATGQTIGGGIAGVASKRELAGIKIYKERKKYNEWEFVYDISKDTSRTGGAVPTQGAAAPGTPIGQQPQSQAQTSAQPQTQTSQQQIMPNLPPGLPPTPSQ